MHSGAMEENDALDLGTRFRINLASLADSRADYTVQQLITALNATTTLTMLMVHGPAMCEPHIHGPVVERLCRCLANVRLQNKHLPLQAVEFLDVDSDIVRQFLVALKQFGILRVRIRSIESLPVHFLTDFCRDNSNLKVLELIRMTFTDGGAADPIDGSATYLNLDKLILNHVEFKTSFAATKFSHFLSHMSVSALELGMLHAKVVVGTGEDVEYVEDSTTKRILAEFKMPSVEQLTLYSSCRVKHFRAALDAGMAIVIQLTVQLSEHRVDGETEKLGSLAHMVRGAVNLNLLTIQTYDGNLRNRPPRQLFQALEACLTVTEIHVNNNYSAPQYFTQSEVQQLRRITVRNNELGQFLANPISFPRDKLLTLMIQLSDCPSGLYMLTLRLPDVFSFVKGDSLFL